MERSSASVGSGIFWCRSSCRPGGRGWLNTKWIPIARRWGRNQPQRHFQRPETTDNTRNHSDGDRRPSLTILVIRDETAGEAVRGLLSRARAPRLPLIVVFFSAQSTHASTSVEVVPFEVQSYRSHRKHRSYRRNDLFYLRLAVDYKMVYFAPEYRSFGDYRNAIPNPRLRVRHRQVFCPHRAILPTLNRLYAPSKQAEGGFNLCK
jgi:hypothetical protein